MIPIKEQQTFVSAITLAIGLAVILSNYRDVCISLSDPGSLNQDCIVRERVRDWFAC